MSLFNLGGGKSKSSSQSSSWGFNTSSSSDISSSLSDSLSRGFSRTRQGVAFEDIFGQLYGGASNAASSALMNAGELTSQARQLFTGGLDVLSTLGNDAGSNYLESALNDDGALLEQQIAQLQKDSGRLFSEELNPAITSRAVAGGTQGGGRQGVAQGLAMEAVNRDFLRGATGLRLADQERKDNIALQVAGNTLAASQTGLGALPGLLDMFERGSNAELGIYANLASILGGPTVLSESDAEDYSQSTARSLSEAFSRSFGQQGSQSSSKGKSWNFGMELG